MRWIIAGILLAIGFWIGGHIIKNLEALWPVISQWAYTLFIFILENWEVPLMMGIALIVSANLYVFISDPPDWAESKYFKIFLVLAPTAFLFLGAFILGEFP